MRRIGLGLTVLVVGACVAAVACSSAAAAVVAGEGSSTVAFAGGIGTFGPGCTINSPTVPFCTRFPFAFQVFATGTSSGGAIGSFTRRNMITGGTFAGRVTCLRIDGPDAAVGGMLTRVPSPGGPGDLVPFGLVLHDGRSTADWVGPLMVFPPNDPTWPLLPPGFPAVCPTPSPLLTAGYFPLTSGGTLVHDG
jgi:hypothetical protein